MKAMKVMLLLVITPFLSFSGENSCSTESCPAECCDPNPCKGWDVYLDWLNWKVRRSDLGYAAPANTNFRLDGRVECVEPDVDSGVRLGIYKQLCGCWDAGARLTHFETSDTNKATAGSGEFLFLSRAAPATAVALNSLQVGVDSAASRYKIELSTFDLEGGFCVDSGCFNGFIRPFAGFKYSSIDQEMDTDYLGSSQSLNTYEKSEMDAYGIYIGLESSLNIWRCLGFFGRASGGLNLAEFHLLHRERNITDPDPVVLMEVKKKSHLVVAHYEFSTGIQWEMCRWKCADWLLQLGYEYHEWCGTTDFLNFVSSSSYANVARSGANLGFDGLFVRLQASF